MPLDNTLLGHETRQLLSLPPSPQAGLLMEADGLVNPVSGIANDYLNVFNEVLLLIENLPILLPEMVDELVTWKPKSYRDYFRSSALPGSAAAILIYDMLDPHLRTRFEHSVKKVDALATECISVIRAKRRPDGELRSEDVEAFCERSAVEIRAALATASRLVNHGFDGPSETPQTMADRILASPGA